MRNAICSETSQKAEKTSETFDSALLIVEKQQSHVRSVDIFPSKAPVRHYDLAVVSSAFGRLRVENMNDKLLWTLSESWKDVIWKDHDQKNLRKSLTSGYKAT